MNIPKCYAENDIFLKFVKSVQAFKECICHFNYKAHESDDPCAFPHILKFLCKAVSYICTRKTVEMLQQIKIFLNYYRIYMESCQRCAIGFKIS